MRLYLSLRRRGIEEADMGSIEGGFITDLFETAYLGLFFYCFVRGMWPPAEQRTLEVERREKRAFEAEQEGLPIEVRRGKRRGTLWLAVKRYLWSQR